MPQQLICSVCNKKIKEGMGFNVKDEKIHIECTVGYKFDDDENLSDNELNEPNYQYEDSDSLFPEDEEDWSDNERHKSHPYFGEQYF